MTRAFACRFGKARGSLAKLCSCLRQRFAAVAINTFASLPDDSTTMKQLLKDFPEKVESANQIGEMPIFRAAAFGCEAAVQLLLQARADPRMKRYDGVAPIEMAALRPDTGAFKLLATARADFTTRLVVDRSCCALRAT